MAKRRKEVCFFCFVNYQKLVDEHFVVYMSLVLLLCVTSL